MHTGTWLRRILVMALVLGSVASVARASMVQALRLEELVDAADHVVLARVMSQESHFDQLGRIVTDVHMQIEEVHKGPEAPGAAVVVRRLGGTVGDVGMRIEGEPTYQDGEHVLLFGSRAAREEVLRPVGMGQGAMRVFERSGARWVHSGTAGLSLVRKGANGRLVPAAPAVPEPRALEDVLAEVRSHLSQSR